MKPTTADISGSIPLRRSTPCVSCPVARAATLALFLLPGCQSPPPSDADRVIAVFGETGLGNGQFSYPRAIAVSPLDGRIFVCDKTARIQRFAPDGRFETGWRMPEWENGKPTGIAADTSGRLWVADTHYHRVIVFDRDGREQFRFGRHGEGPGEFVFPTCIAWDADANIYVGEYGGNDRLSKFSPDRRSLASFADRTAGPGALERPTQIKFDEHGILWVADGCHHRICRYDTSGRFLGSFGRPGRGPSELNYPYGLELRPGSPPTVVVADQGNNRIVEFSREGRFLRAWGSPGRDRGQVLHPWAIAAGRDGVLYVLDSWNNRVQVLRW